MPVRLVITTYAKPGKGAELAQAMAERCRAVQQEPGCQHSRSFRAPSIPTSLSRSSSGTIRQHWMSTHR